MTAFDDNDRRVRVFYASDRELTRLFDVYATKPPHQLVYHNPDIPAGARVVSVHYCWERRSFGVMFSHPSFAVVPEGAFPPDATRHGVWSVLPWAEVSDADMPHVVGGAA